MPCDKIALILLGLCGIIFCIRVEHPESSDSNPSGPVPLDKPINPPSLKSPELDFLDDGNHSFYDFTVNFSLILIITNRTEHNLGRYMELSELYGRR